MALTLNQNLNQDQQNSIYSLVNNGQQFNETDARNFAYATGQKDFNQFVGKNTSDFNYLSPKTDFKINYNGTADTNQLTGTTSKADLQSVIDKNASYQQQYEDLMSKVYQPVQSIQDERNALIKSQNDAMTRLNSKGARTAELYNQAGIQNMTKQLQDLNTLASDTLSSYNEGMTNIENKVIPMEFVTGQQAALRNQGTNRLNAISNLQNSLYNNINLARQNVQDIVNSEFAGAEQEINNIKTRLEQNYQTMTAAQQKAATELLYVLDQKQNDINQAKDDRKQILAIASTALGQGVDEATLANILQSKTPEEAMRLGRQYIKNGNYSIVGTGKYDGNGNEIKGVFDSNTGTFKSSLGNTTNNQTSAGVVTTSTGDRYDIGSYATDPNHETAVQSILNRIGQMTSIQQMDSYIQQVAPGSPVTGQMIANAASKYGVSWEMMMAIMQQDSSFGTAGKAVRTLNPGNVGNTDSGATVTMKSWQDGVDAVAKNLAWRKSTNQNTTVNSNNQRALDIILGSGKFTKDQKASIKKAISNGEDAFTVIKNQGKALLSGSNQTDLENYEVIQGQLQSLDSMLKEFYANGGQTNIFKGNLEKTINNLGEVQDPKLVSIAVNIASSLQAYRNAISGTAYSNQEGKDIASIFPGINKTSGLNEAIIKGRLKFVNDTIDEKYKSVLGKVYTDLKNETTDNGRPKLETFHINDNTTTGSTPNNVNPSISKYIR